MAVAAPRVEGYDMGAVVGQGTQGTVYRATTRGEHRREVAIKVVLKSRLSKAGRDNLVTEIALLKKLKHRFIVDLVDFHWDDRNIYIVTEFCSGGDLSSTIRARQKLPERQVRRLAQQLAAALQFLRQHDVSHLDLKPSNLLVSASRPPVLKLADFGFAQHLAPEGHERGLKGSPLYMAPEILLRDSYTAKADLWSVGVILYEALHGRAPFSSGSLEELLARIKEERAVELPARQPALSAHCRDLLGRCLVRNPEKRIDFADFFDHPFLDLEHLASPDSLAKAAKLVQEAVVRDRAGEREAALRLYQQSLRYFRPLLLDTPDAALQRTVSGYERRAAELRRPADSCPPDDAELTSLCSSSPRLLAGLEVCRAGALYAGQGAAAQGLVSLTAGLGELVPLVQAEPRGRRRELLGRAVQGWLRLAEAAKEAEAREGEVAEGEEGKASCAVM